MDTQGRSKDDFTCPICMYIMIQPVTMPCKHSLCMMCYKQCVEKASLACPICRLRIAVWARKNSKANTLVDKGLWETIQKLFPRDVKNQIEGKESSDDGWDSPSYIETELRKIKELSEPGEIRLEYEAALAKLERQRQEEAEKEEEASVALIKDLLEKEKEELAELTKEKEEHEKLGRLAAEQLDQIEINNRSLRRAREFSPKQSKKQSKNGNKEKRCGSVSTVKLESFYNSIRKSSTSAPPYSELATTLTHSQIMSKSNQGAKTNISPYPYCCISPSDKQSKSASFPSEVACEENGLSHQLQEHSYTTASAERIDLTSQDECEELCFLRDDVQQFVKTEPPDIDEENPLADIGVSPMKEMSHIFQPISSSLRTPPKKLPSGEIVDPELIRCIPRSLTFCGNQLQNTSSLSPSSCSSEIFPDQGWCSNADKLDSENLNEKQLVSSSTVSFERLSREREKDDYLDKIKLTQKIVYGTSSHIKKSPVSSSCSSSLLVTQPSSLSRPTSSSSSSSATSKNNLCPNSTATTEPLPSSLRCINNNVLNNSKAPVDKDTSDYFITDESQLVIPLETDIKPIHTDSDSETQMLMMSRSCRTPNENLTDVNRLGVSSDQYQKSWTHDNDHKVIKPSKFKTITKHPLLQKKGSKSKNVIPPASSSIREWCTASKRKLSSDSVESSIDFKISSEKPRTMEEADRLLALELQKKFSELDRRHINVERFEGSSNEYSLRKKRRLC